jgi:SAM-dependent methyltransferase
VVDPTLIKRFKQVSREDHQIAEILAGVVDLRAVESILEIGAGPGVISRTLAASAKPGCRVAVIEPNSPEYTFEDTTQVCCSTWEHAKIEDTFDLVLMSHVMGHFDPPRRTAEVTRAAANLTPQGTLAIVTNGPAEPFWSLNLAIGQNQGTQYVIDFDSLEAALKNQFLSVARLDPVTPLNLGETEEDYVDLMNAFFPQPFSSSDVAKVMALAAQLHDGTHYVLPMTQRTYLASLASETPNWRVDSDCMM